MSDPQRNRDPWQPCRPGTILDAANRQAQHQQQSRRSFLTKVVAGAFSGAAVALIAMVSANGINVGESKQPDGIACVQVHQQLSKYIDNKIDDKSLRCQISQHLFKCQNCRRICKSLARGEEIYNCKTRVKFPPIRCP